MEKLKFDSILNDLHPADEFRSLEFRSPDVVGFCDNIYPRIAHDPVVVKEYAANLGGLPPIQINQYDMLIDGNHRLLANRTQGVDEIPVVVTEAQSDIEHLCLAIRANKLTDSDKKKSAALLYADGTGLTKDQIAEVLSVSEWTVRSHLVGIDSQLHRILDLHLEGYAQEEIADQLEASIQDVQRIVDSFASTSDESLVYNICDFGKLLDGANHFQKPVQWILDGLLHLYTPYSYSFVWVPFYDRYAADVCRYRLREFSMNPNPSLAMVDLIRQPLPNRDSRWSLTFIHPDYSESALPDRELGSFIAGLAELVNRVCHKQLKGVIAMLIKPSWADHVVNLVSAGGLDAKHRVSCPPARAGAISDKDLIARELIIWQV